MSILALQPTIKLFWLAVKGYDNVLFTFPPEFKHKTLTRSDGKEMNFRQFLFSFLKPKLFDVESKLSFIFRDENVCMAHEFQKVWWGGSLVVGVGLRAEGFKKDEN